MKGSTERHISRLKLLAVVLSAIIIIIMGGVFILLIKVKGNISYLYNFMVQTKGGLEAEYTPTAANTAGSAEPYAVESTRPERFLNSTALYVNGKITEDYHRSIPFSFTDDVSLQSPERKGIITFRGNYNRSLTSYGSIELSDQIISDDYWRYRTGKALKCDGVNYWSGNGWTGQPLAVQWEETEKQFMNLYPEARSKQSLVEVIYPGMDGQIHFLDMETGKETRDAINVGMTFKGTCSLHPEYPLLVCGSGDSQPGIYGEQVSARIFIYSLIDGSLLYEMGANDSFAPRIWHAYDSSPIFCSAADSLICPGENGVLYTIQLNTSYNAASGTLSINPSEPVQYTYDAATAATRVYSGEGGYGSEASAVVWEHFLFLGDNGGIFYCLDLNTMKPVWVQDLLEDINSSPVFEMDENGNKYIYVATTLKYHTNEHHIGQACVYKLNAMTGEIIWKKPYEVHTVLGLAGGFLSTGVPGRGEVSDLIFYSVSKVPDVDTGYIIALEKSSGKERWRMELDCDAWSSGALLTDMGGKTYLVQCCSNGDILLIDAKKGEVITKKNFGSNIEATPVIYKNRLTVGLRSEYILGIEFK